MSVLVAYASKHGSTRGIAERIAERLRAGGLEAEVLPVKGVRDPAAYDAFVIGSAAYMFHWMKEATGFVRRNRKLLAGNPVWLFSSGPVGPDKVDAQGRDVLTVTVPREIAEFEASIRPRDHAVFFGAHDPTAGPIGFTERLVALMPAARSAFPAGDFRDWPRIEAWADVIAAALAATAPAR
jgi:menaquinone-dependent protoporphyrinogen oxidase